MTLRKFLNFDPAYDGQGLRFERGLKYIVWQKFAGVQEALRQAAIHIRKNYEGRA